MKTADKTIEFSKLLNQLTENELTNVLGGSIWDDINEILRDYFNPDNN